MSFILWNFTTLAMAQAPPQTPVDLGSAANFALLGNTALTNVPPSVITGNVGVSPGAESTITGFSQTNATGYATSPQVIGKIYAADMAAPTPAMLATAMNDLTTAFNDAAGRTPVPSGGFLNPGGGDLAGLDLAPGLYKFTGGAAATTNFTLTGSATDVWIFQIATSLDVSNGVQVTLAGGAQASNIFWQVGTSATFGTTSVFHGTVMADQSITLQSLATLNGRALTRSALISLDTTTVTIPLALSLQYVAGPNGTITGATSQTLNFGDSGTTVTAVPNTGYHFTQWSDNLTSNPRRDTTVTTDTTVTASFAIDQYHLAYLAGPNGSLAGVTSQTVDYGTSGTAVTAVPNTGYHFTMWSDNLTSNPRLDTNVTTDTTVTASFAINQYHLAYLAGPNGSLAGVTSQTVDYGTSGTAVTAVPDTGYHFTNWSDASTANPRTDMNVTADTTVTANFAINQYQLTYTAGPNGSISGAESQTVDYGTSGTAVTAEPNIGYHFVNWSDSVTSNPRTDTNVTTNISVVANFAINQYTLTYAAGANGSVIGATTQTVNYGADGSAVTAVPDTGYHFVKWTDNSTVNPRTDTYVTGDVNVTAIFAINQYTLNYTADSNGSISGPASQIVDYGTSGTAVLAVPNTGYHFVKWSDTLTSNPRRDTNVKTNINVNAIFGQGPTPVSLGSISGANVGSTTNFAILAGAAITNIPTSAIKGDIGLTSAGESLITGFSLTDATGYATSAQVTGKIYAANMAAPTPAMLTTAKSDLILAYDDAAERTPVPTGAFLNPGNGNLAGLNLAPGLYKFTSTAGATSDFTLTGGPNDVWIFQVGSALNISNDVQVTLAGGAQASNIFWQVGTFASFGTNSAFQGIVMADTSITLQNGAKLSGRALVTSGTVSLDASNITVPPITYTIAGTVSGATTGTMVDAIDKNGTVLEQVAVNADGTYVLTVPDEFSGWVVPESGTLVFHPFRRAFNHLSAVKVGVNFTAFPCVLTKSDLDADYKITYKKDGKGNNVSDRDISITSGALVIANPGTKDTLAISRSQTIKKANGIPRAIRSISTSGGLAKLTIEGDVMDLSVGGDLGQLTAANAVACDIVTSGGLGAISMTSRPDVDNVDMITNIVANGSLHKKASVVLKGAKVETLVARTQDFGAISLITKQDGKTRKVQMSGLLGGVGATADVYVHSAQSINANGAAITPNAISGAIKTLQASSIQIKGVPYPGSIDVVWFNSSADNVTIQATGGKITGGCFVSSGKIAKFAATANKNFEGSGVIGEKPTTASLQLTTSTAGGVEVARIRNTVFAVSGVNPPAGNSNITNVTAPAGLYGVFYAGATMSGNVVNGLPVMVKLTPNHAGSLVAINASNNVASDSIARVYATTQNGKKTKVLPKGAPVTLIYNDGE